LNDPNLILRGQGAQDYKEGDDVYFSVDFEELKNGEWVPYVATDIQLEFVRLDPYWRINLQSKLGSKTYSGTLRTPDQNGVFKFRLDYTRYGYSRIFIEEVAPNRIW